MKKTTLFLLFVCLMNSLLGQDGMPLFHRVKVDLQGKSVAPLNQLGIETDHGTFYPGKYLINDFSEDEIGQIEAAGYEVDVLITDMVSHYQSPDRDKLFETRGLDDCNTNNQDKYTVPANFTYGSMGGFFTYQEMLYQLDQMKLKYPDLISSREPIGTYLTNRGNNIYWLKISDNPETDEAEPGVLYTALHHAREPNSLSQLIFHMWYLLENYESDEEIRYLVDHTQLYFIPCVNPDGYLYNQTISPNGGGMWRKNRRPLEGGSVGTDLNRNYGYEWGYDNSGSSPNPQSDTFRGTAPFSEVETRAVRDFCQARDIKVAMNYHTYGNLLVFPWGYSDSPTPDAAFFSNWADLYTLQNQYQSGTGSETVGYTVNGDADDWMYGARAIISMTPEVGGGGAGGGFWPPLNRIISNCQASMWMNLSAVRVLHRFGIARDIGPKLIAIDQPNIQFALTRYGLAGGPLTVEVKPLSAKIRMVNSSKTYHNLDLYEEVKDFLSWELLGDMVEGESVLFELRVDNGDFVIKDTIQKLIHLYPAAYADDLASNGAWTDASSWGLSSSDFVSAPFSMTDSPLGDYQSESTNSIETKNYIPVQNFTDAYLNFWAKWVTESDFDFVQVKMAVNDGDFFPLCGQYSEAGTPSQKEGEPVYDGAQLEWVNENILLSDYLMPGDSFKLRFELITDRFINEDGFYFDDLKIYFFTEDTINSIEIDDNEFFVKLFPNPSKDKINLSYQSDQAGTQAFQLSIYDVSGRLIHTENTLLGKGLDFSLTVQDWPPGLYIGVLESEKGGRQRLKFVVSDGE
ncbi:MAG: M14 family zinc carboxypeptidase [Saprospiraceae bacterium]